jgi:signal transduction histidine kinase
MPDNQMREACEHGISCSQWDDFATEDKIGSGGGFDNRPEGDRLSTKVGGGDRLRSPVQAATRHVRCDEMPARLITIENLFAPAEDDPPPTRRSRRDWIVDGVLFAIAIGLGVGSLISSSQHGLPAALVVVDAVCGFGLCAGLWERRRWPFALGLASLPISVVSSSAGPAALIILYTVAAYRRWQLAVFLGAVSVALLPAERAIHSQGDSLASYYILGVLCTAVVIAWGMFRRGRLAAQRERALRRQAEEQLRVEQIRHGERERIAREMHDVLAHRISLLSLHAGALEFRPDASAEEISRAAAVIRATAHQALEDLRAVIGLLRDGSGGQAPPPPQPTLAALPGLLDESRAAGMRLHADVGVADLAAVPDAVGRHALRIVQEALTNARKHAPSAPVDLRLEGAAGEGLTIEVRNPLPVLTAAPTQIPGSGTGLVGLSERAILSGGRLDYELDEEEGFRLRAWLPWPR